MLICFACPTCKSRLEIEGQFAGSQIVCPKCNTALTVPKCNIGPGVSLGGFRIEKTLGRGGMGEVYLACQKSMDRKIALKVLPRALTAQQDAVDRFRSEVRVLAQLKHPNIVTAYEAGEDDGVHFLAMEYVEGETLEQVLKRGKPLPEKQALGLTLKLSEALGQVWADHSMVHRDIKPANILLDRHGEPKLADMGLSRIASSRPGMTVVGEVMGTPNYMSPEQADGLAGVDFRADIYSLGATLYNMLTARVPFVGATFTETLRKQASEKLQNPCVANPKVSSACVALLDIMLARRANRRASRRT